MSVKSGQRRTGTPGRTETVIKNISQQPSPGRIGEFEAYPPVLIVHNPVEAGAFRAMEEFQVPSRLEAEFLFRELPDIKNYDKQHRFLPNC